MTASLSTATNNRRKAEPDVADGGSGRGSSWLSPRACSQSTSEARFISGHQTDDMVELYSSINPAEQRHSIGKVIDLMTGKPIGYSSGALGGAPEIGGGAPTKKAG